MFLIRTSTGQIFGLDSGDWTTILLGLAIVGLLLIFV